MMPLFAIELFIAAAVLGIAALLAAAVYAIVRLSPPPAIADGFGDAPPFVLGIHPDDLDRAEDELARWAQDAAANEAMLEARMAAFERVREPWA